MGLAAVWLSAKSGSEGGVGVAGPERALNGSLRVRGLCGVSETLSTESVDEKGGTNHCLSHRIAYVRKRMHITHTRFEIDHKAILRLDTSQGKDMTRALIERISRSAEISIYIFNQTEERKREKYLKRDELTTRKP